MRWVSIAVGGALGSAARWCVAYALVSFWFPVATLSVNAAGSYALGWLYGRTNDASKHSAWYQGVASGFLGAFTTMSAFGLETWTLVTDGRWATAVAYAAVSALAGPWLAGLGMRLGRAAVKQDRTERLS